MIRPGEVFGDFRMLGLLGRGGMAEVYLAQPLAGPPTARVAVKRLLTHHAENDKFVSMLVDEARIAAAIDHPNVARVYGFGTAGGSPFLAMEYVDGVDLGRVLRRIKTAGARLPLAAALYVARCVADGLHAAHSLVDADGHPQEVIHRDVSPHNVLVSHAGEVKLIDFGVAKARSNSTRTKSGVIKGKLQYMSPEQAQAQPVDARADLFSLGMTLYRMVTGRLPFVGKTDYQIYDQILRRPTPAPRQYVPDLPERVEAILLRALRKDRGQRFPSAGAMAAVLELALEELEPGYGAPHLAALLAGVLDAAAEGPEEGGEGSSAEAPAPQAQAPVLDAHAVERLTRVEELPGGFAATQRVAVTPARGTRLLDPPGGLPVEAVALPAPIREGPHGTRIERVGPLDTGDALPATVIHGARVSAARASAPLANAAPAGATSAGATSAGATSAGATSAGAGWEGAAPPPGPPRRLSRPSGVAPVPSLTDLVRPVRPWRHLPLVLLAAGIGILAALLWIDRAPPRAPTSGPVQGLRPPAAPLFAAGGGPARPGLGPGSTARAALGGGAATTPDAGAPDPGDPDPGTPDAGAPDAGARDAAAPDLQDAAPDAAWPEPKLASGPRRPASPAAKPTPPRVSPRARRPGGYLTLNALPWAHVEVDGRRLDRHTPIHRAPVPAGQRKITFISPSGARHNTQVEVLSGEEVRVVHRFAH